ncbi:MAG: flavohemoglobin expression-modulating QEGLA motif protein [Verrucomicrobia bacterium]|nr:flavohemoglobin expression-modulating QEGLA motif protein [Verrucomicrobiota bacterium]
MPQGPTKTSRTVRALSDRRIDAIIDRLHDNKPVRRTFPGWGRLHIDRQLPFLCVYRRPPRSTDTATDRLLVAEASYALAPGTRTFHKSLVKLIEGIADVMVDRFGCFLVVEVWAGAEGAPTRSEIPPQPGFKVCVPRTDDLSTTVETLCERLSSIRTSKQKAEVSVHRTSRIGPPSLPPLFSSMSFSRRGLYIMGVEVKPVYLDAGNGEAYPLLLRSLKRQFRRALDQAFYEFSVEHTTHQPTHYYALGRRAMVKAVWDIDRRLAAVSNSFDLLLEATPINAEQAWSEFRRRRFQKPPTFLYRPRPVDPGKMKRLLYDIHIDRVEDPTLMHLFLDKQLELDRQLTMLQDLGKRAFMYGGLQLYGEVRAPLVALAQEILDTTPSRSRIDSRGGFLTPTEFAEMARAEIAWYTERDPDFTATVEIRDDLYAGLMVSHGRLLIGIQSRIPASRAQALIQHEVGTHMLTYFNGRAQPFKMLYTGLPGYDELQEGLAVLAEYLVGGLSKSRLRILAARVFAVHSLIEGAGFVEVFRALDRNYDFAQRTAFTITMRVFRGGGLTKDAIYLRGLVRVLEYIAKAGEFERLLVGKIAAAHLGVVKELLLRKILKPPPLHPRYLEQEDAQKRLTEVRKGMRVTELISL